MVESYSGRLLIASPLASVDPLTYIDALRGKIRHEDPVREKALHVARVRLERHEGDSRAIQKWLPCRSPR
jgi:hypothetical protein